LWSRAGLLDIATLLSSGRNPAEVISEIRERSPDFVVVSEVAKGQSPPTDLVRALEESVKVLTVDPVPMGDKTTFWLTELFTDSPGDFLHQPGTKRRVCSRRLLIGNVVVENAG